MYILICQKYAALRRIFDPIRIDDTYRVSDQMYRDTYRIVSSKRYTTLVSCQTVCCLLYLCQLLRTKNGKIGNTDNYRPIALATVVSKTVETIILHRMSAFLDTNCNQFGFKRKLGTDMCIYVMKELVNKYKTLNGSIFMCFLDASKAFDRVKHSVLFRKLVRRRVPGYIVRLLAYWYSHQTMCVKWGNTMSGSFSVSNGVRQGGILSPYLFKGVFTGKVAKIVPLGLKFRVHFYTKTCLYLQSTYI